MRNNALPVNISARLLKEAIRQSAEKGAGNVSAKSIVRAVGCSDRLIQYYFTCVEGMWIEAVKYCQNALYDAYRAFFESKGDYTLTDVWNFAYRYFMNHPYEMTFYSQVKQLHIHSYAPYDKMCDLMTKAFRTAINDDSVDSFEACKRIEFICDNANGFARRVTCKEIPGDEDHVRMYMDITFKPSMRN